MELYNKPYYYKNFNRKSDYIFFKKVYQFSEENHITTEFINHINNKSYFTLEETNLLKIYFIKSGIHHLIYDKEISTIKIDHLHTFVSLHHDFYYTKTSLSESLIIREDNEHFKKLYKKSKITFNDKVTLLDKSISMRNKKISFFIASSFNQEELYKFKNINSLFSNLIFSADKKTFSILYPYLDWKYSAHVYFQKEEIKEKIIPFIYKIIKEKETEVKTIVYQDFQLQLTRFNVPQNFSYNKYLMDKFTIKEISLFLKKHPNSFGTQWISYLSRILEIFPDINQQLLTNVLKQIDPQKAKIIHLDNLENHQLKFLSHYPEKRILNLLIYPQGINFSFVFSTEIEDINKAIDKLKTLGFTLDQIFPKKPKSLKQVHDFISKFLAKQKQINFQLEQPEINFLENKTVDIYQLHLPRNSHELIDIGQQLNICIGNSLYAQKIKEKKCNILLLSVNNTLVGCVEIQKGEIIQARGKDNQTLPFKLSKTIKEQIKQNLKENNYCSKNSNLV